MTTSNGVAGRLRAGCVHHFWEDCDGNKVFSGSVDVGRANALMAEAADALDARAGRHGAGGRDNARRASQGQGGQTLIRPVDIPVGIWEQAREVTGGWMAAGEDESNEALVISVARGLMKRQQEVTEGAAQAVEGIGQLLVEAADELRSEEPFSTPHNFFTPDEVENLAHNQMEHQFHPFTCPNRGDGNHRLAYGDTGALVPTVRGWICPFCDYTQDWAHEFMKSHKHEKTSGWPGPRGFERPLDSIPLPEDEK